MYMFVSITDTTGILAIFVGQLPTKIRADKKIWSKISLIYVGRRRNSSAKKTDENKLDLFRRFSSPTKIILTRGKN